MKLYQVIFFLFLAFFLSACTPKLTVKSLNPSKIPNEKIFTIEIEEFINDDINQASRIEDKIANKIIDNKKVFKLTNNQFSDAIITGEVLESSLSYDIYYKKHINYKRCRYYRYDEKTKKRTCVKYYVRFIPCENRDYTVKTKVRVLKPSTQIVLFSKTYNKSRSTQECYDQYYYPYHTFPRYKKDINSKLANEIANEVIDDISPHYVYYNLEIIDELNEENLNFTKIQEEKFKSIVKLIENKQLSLAQELLEKLDYEFKGKSWEVLYNLGLVYEGQRNLDEANKNYEDAKLNVKEIDDLVLITNAIKRTKRNLKEKIKAKSQLTY